MEFRGNFGPVIPALTRKRDNMNVSIHTHAFNKNTIKVEANATGTTWNPWLSFAHTAVPKSIDDDYVYVMPDEVTFHLSELTINEAATFIAQGQDAFDQLAEWNAQRMDDENEDVAS